MYPPQKFMMKGYGNAQFLHFIPTDSVIIVTIFSKSVKRFPLLLAQNCYTECSKSVHKLNINDRYNNRKSTNKEE